MILLDTDHITVLRYVDDPRSLRLKNRLLIAIETDDVATTIITVEEQMRGWLTRLHAERNIRQQIFWYEKLFSLLGFFQSWNIALIDDSSVRQFLKLRDQRIRIGTQDLKIASIALARDALLLSANLRDFTKVPGLRVEDWLI
ncbi:MAG TPA: type II toxin-antitoxin system VapC family toxin [Planctomycetaceae bacterium]